MRHIFDLKPLIHNLIIRELILKTLEYDKVQMAGPKMRPVLEEWYETKSKEIFSEIQQVKKELLKDGCKIDSHTNDGMFTEYVVVVRGETHHYRYSNIALRNWCREEMRRLLGMPYRTPDDRK